MGVPSSSLFPPSSSTRSITLGGQNYSHRCLWALNPPSLYTTMVPQLSRHHSWSPVSIPSLLATTADQNGFPCG
ncbi:hypothetical protein DL769_004789 [Monosporascus sp. CRB-8-3]|nr:hypothetical protein DL769_004789 [Monosporascus sp. CRB-8-3]